MEILDTIVLGSTLSAWLYATAIALVLFLALSWLKAAVKRRVAATAEQTTTGFDDGLVTVLAATRTLSLLVFAIFFASLVLELGEPVRRVFATVTMLAFIVQAGLWASAALRFLLQLYAERQLQEDAAATTTMNAVGFIARLALWVVVLLVALDNLGVDITALVTGLGIGGIAVALALQSILSDLFASLTIVLDKPFVLKDFLIVNEFLGSVEHIGLKTTRLRSLSGEQLVFSNADLLSSRIRNYGRMYERRVVFTIGVVYQTPRSKIQVIPNIIRSAIEAQEKTRFDRAHFKEYGPYSLNFEAVYYVLDPTYLVYMDIQQAINLFIHEQFEAEGIEFAYPSQTIFVANRDQTEEAS